MKQIYAFEKIEEYAAFQDIIARLRTWLDEYQYVLADKYALTSMPKGIVWTTEELATTVLSTIPIPAFTSKHIIYMSPDLLAWKKLFLKQLEGKSLPHIQNFYENFSEKHLFIILAHELTHHSDLFVDDFEDVREDSIWFEEGMCFYLPRKVMLNEKEFEEITTVESELVELFKDKYGNHSIDVFGRSSYQGTLTSIMYDYWRSYLAVKYLVEVRAKGNINMIFQEYHKWNNEGRKVPLTKYFELD